MPSDILYAYYKTPPYFLNNGAEIVMAYTSRQCFAFAGRLDALIMALIPLVSAGDGFRLLTACAVADGAGDFWHIYSRESAFLMR